MELPKVVLSHTLTDSPWKNTGIISGAITDEVTKLTKSEGRAILVCGGASFATSLIQHNLADEYYFLLNPFRLGQGLTIFKPKDKVQLFSLQKSKSFPCGTILLHYDSNE